MSSGATTITKSAEKHVRKQAAACEKAYLYAIVADAQAQTYGDFGIDGKSVYSIAAGRIAAVVSNVRIERVRPERARLAAHQEVLKRLLTTSTPLPMSFGILADSPEAVRKMLSRNQQAFLEQLRRVAGKVEMGLRITDRKSVV